MAPSASTRTNGSLPWTATTRGAPNRTGVSTGSRIKVCSVRRRTSSVVPSLKKPLSLLLLSNRSPARYFFQPFPVNQRSREQRGGREGRRQEHREESNQIQEEPVTVGFSLEEFDG